MSESGDRMETTDVTESAEPAEPTPHDKGRRSRHRAVRPRTRRPEAQTTGEVVFEAQDRVRLLRRLPGDPERHAPHLPQPDHRAHRSLRLWQDHVHPLPESDERPDRGRARGGNAAVSRRRSVRREGGSGRGRRRIGMVFQKPNPFPKSIYDNIAFGPKIAGLQGQHGRAGGGVAAPRGAVGRGEGQAQGVRARALGWTAAAPVHRAGDRDQARCDPDGRAVLGARPDRDPADRGPDAGAPLRLHDRDRDAQHAAGRTGLGPHGLLHRRGARRRPASERERSSSTTRPRRSSRTRATLGRRTTSRGGSGDGAAALPRGARADGAAPAHARGAGGQRRPALGRGA